MPNKDRSSHRPLTVSTFDPMWSTVEPPIRCSALHNFNSLFCMYSQSQYGFYSSLGAFPHHHRLKIENNPIARLRSVADRKWREYSSLAHKKKGQQHRPDHNIYSQTNLLLPFCICQCLWLSQLSTSAHMHIYIYILRMMCALRMIEVFCIAFRASDRQSPGPKNRQQAKCENRLVMRMHVAAIKCIWLKGMLAANQTANFWIRLCNGCLLVAGCNDYERRARSRAYDDRRADVCVCRFFPLGCRELVQPTNGRWFFSCWPLNFSTSQAMLQEVLGVLRWLHQPWTRGDMAF